MAPSSHESEAVQPPTWRDRCYACFRPRSDCYCDAIPSIANRTEVLILQHRRERFHPFNTARIVQQALQNSRLLADHTCELAKIVRLRPRAGLLYPGPQATLISELPADQRPDQLVVLDGTWHHAKTLMRDIPGLRELPRLRLAPESPSNYRIRREPDAQFLSTVEATVAALRALEPETVGLERLLDAFAAMVDRQLAHPKSEWGRRTIQRAAARPSCNVPSALLGDLANVVVAYGESVAGQRGRKRTSRTPIYWIARRLGDDRRFSSVVQPDFELDETFLKHLELPREHFENAASPDEFRAAWSAFLRPSDTLVVYHPQTVWLLKNAGVATTRCLTLKAVEFDPTRHYGTLEELVEGEALLPSAPQFPGRAGKRLANLEALVAKLNSLRLTME